MCCPERRRPCKFCWLALLILVGISAGPAAFAATLRVKAGSTNAAPDGATWTNAFGGVIEALTVAQSGDELWVAAGTYPGGFTLTNSVALYGGFAGGETSREQRQFTLNLTRLDGGRATNVLSITNGAGPTTRVDGFIIQHGLANGTGVAGSGGGLRVINTDPVIVNNQFLSNNCVVTGGALYLQSSSATVQSNYFGFNGLELTARTAGALYVTTSSPRLENNSFVGNRGLDGGAVYFSASTGFILRNSLLNNAATRDGGGLLCNNASPQVSYNRFLGNTAVRLGGGAALTGGGASLVFNNVFTRNAAATGSPDFAGGGGVYSDAISQPTLLNNTLVLNQAPVGGLLLSNRNASAANNIIALGSSGVGGEISTRFQTNNVYGNGVNYVGGSDLTGAQGNLSADPQFAGDVSLGVVNILPTSPCRDAGNSELLPAGPTDIDGQPRVQGPSVDIGADETDGVTTYFLPTVVRVAPTGDDLNDGSAWTSPLRSVQAAIELAGRRGGEVWVEAGTYVENLTLRPFTSMYGGFEGTETNRVDRNWRTRETILDGGGTGRVITIPTLQYDEAVDGFTIQNGREVAGGGVYAVGKVRLVNNRFVSNQSLPATLTTQAQGGGALHLAGGDVLVSNNTFTHNVALANTNRINADGGAIKLTAGQPTIINNLFRMNLATNSAATGTARGGALLVLLNSTPRVINNTFLLNSVGSATATAAYERGGAIAFEGTVNTNIPGPLLVNNLIAYNSSGVSGRGQEPQAYNNLVWGSLRANYEDMRDLTGTNGNLSVSPALTGPYGDAHLTASSPARDAGDDSLVSNSWVDLDGGARVVGDAPDIGADEYDGTTYQIPARVFYVSPSGSDTNNGTTWSTAKQTIGAALAAAEQEGGEVWVQAGTYLERVRVGLFTYLFGGFKGDETSRDARNWSAQLTVLDGGADPNVPIAGNPVATVVGTDGYATVDGLTIQNGAARLGGAFRLTGSPLIAHNLIRSNLALSTSATLVAAGGAIYCDTGAPTILNNVLVANQARNLARATNSLGGAIYLNLPAGQVASLFNNTLLTNRAGIGGGVFLGTNSGARVNNNIVAFGSSGLVALNSTNTARFNALFGNTTDDIKGFFPGAGNIFEDPRLVDWQAGNYRLRADSPLINKGDPAAASGALDFYAEPRRAETAPEIGADEFSGPYASEFSLALAQPISGSVYVAPATVFLAPTITGSDTRPAYIEYLANDAVVAVSKTEPFSTFSSELILGDYRLLARAVTAGGAMATSGPVAISVLLPPNNVPPTVDFLSPTNSQVFVSPANVRTSFRWAKTNGRVTSWHLFANDALVASNPSVPAGTTSATVTVSNLLTADFVFTAIVHDNVGTHGTNTVRFTVGLPYPTASEPAPPQRLPDGSVAFEFSAPTESAAYILENTRDLVLWLPVSTNQGGAPIRFVIPATNMVPIEAFRTRAFYP